jgi:hypothetical protein
MPRKTKTHKPDVYLTSAYFLCDLINTINAGRRALVLAGHPRSVIDRYDAKQFARRNRIESDMSAHPERYSL